MLCCFSIIFNICFFQNLKELDKKRPNRKKKITYWEFLEIAFDAHVARENKTVLTSIFNLCDTKGKKIAAVLDLRDTTKQNRKTIRDLSTKRQLKRLEKELEYRFSLQLPESNKNTKLNKTQIPEANLLEEDYIATRKNSSSLRGNKPKIHEIKHKSKNEARNDMNMSENSSIMSSAALVHNMSKYSDAEVWKVMDFMESKRSDPESGFSRVRPYKNDNLIDRSNVPKYQLTQHKTNSITSESSKQTTTNTSSVRTSTLADSLNTNQKTSGIRYLTNRMSFMYGK